MLRLKLATLVFVCAARWVDAPAVRADDEDTVSIPSDVARSLLDGLTSGQCSIDTPDQGDEAIRVLRGSLRAAAARSRTPNCSDCVVECLSIDGGVVLPQAPIHTGFASSADACARRATQLCGRRFPSIEEANGTCPPPQI
jgi:hypothetical protein